MAMKEYFQALMREKVCWSSILTAARAALRVKPGAVMLAQMSGRPMPPLSYAATRAWLIHRDKFTALAWLADCDCHWRTVPRGTDAAGIERIQKELADQLHATFKAARQALVEAKRNG
jgi:hypothetical protein